MGLAISKVPAEIASIIFFGLIGGGVLPVPYQECIDLHSFAMRDFAADRSSAFIFSSILLAHVQHAVVGISLLQDLLMDFCIWSEITGSELLFRWWRIGEVPDLAAAQRIQGTSATGSLTLRVAL